MHPTDEKLPKFPSDKILLEILSNITYIPQDKTPDRRDRRAPGSSKNYIAMTRDFL